MVVRYENMWISIPALLIPIAFVIIMMGFIKIWMVGTPVKRRPFPQYSLHVMHDLPSDKPQATRAAAYYPYQKPQRPKSDVHVLPFVKGGNNAMKSGLSTPRGPPPLYYSLTPKPANTPRQWQGKFL